MQKILVLLSIGYKSAENHFLLFMNNKIAQGRPSIIIDGWKEILPTAGAKMNVRERRNSYVHNRPSACGTTNQGFLDVIRNRKGRW